MNYTLIQNVNALLDSENIQKDFDIRAQYLSKTCELELEAALLFLQGEEKLPPGKLKTLADQFDVEIQWLVGK